MIELPYLIDKGVTFAVRQARESRNAHVASAAQDMPTIVGGE